jgi:flagellar protein FliO/FliZ
MDWMDWVRAVFALAATLALIGLGWLAARRFKLIETLGVRGGEPRRLKVVERLLLDPRRSLVIVEIDGRAVTLLLSPFGDREVGHDIGGRE